jgi:hypothetical protein
VKTKAAISEDGLPKNFLSRFGEHVTGFLNGLDRVRFRATLRPLFCPNGPEVYLNYCKVLIKNSKGFAQGLSDRVKKLAYDRFQQAGRPNVYLPSSELSKEALVQDLVIKEQIKEGPIALLSCVEPCLSFRVRGDRQTKTLRLVMESAKCTHLYHYYQHPQIGLMHIRVQTWFPFSVDVCINGRQWLARQMDRDGLDYQQRDNCFTWIEDSDRLEKSAAAEPVATSPLYARRCTSKRHNMYCPLYSALCRAWRLTCSFEQLAKNSQNQNERTTNASKRFPLGSAALFSDSFHKLPIRSFGCFSNLRRV